MKKFPTCNQGLFTSDRKKLTVTLAIKNDNIYLKHPGGTSSTDPDQTLWSVASDQGLY